MSDLVGEIDIILHENKQLREQNRVLRQLVQDVVNSGVAFEDGRIPYKEVQIDRMWFDDAQAALTATSQPAKPAGKMHACDIPGCVSCGNPEDATSQEGQHGSR